MFSRKISESPVIFVTCPLKTGSFSRRLYCFFEAFSTIAIMPCWVFTIPFITTWSMIKQRAPVVHTVVVAFSCCNRRGLTNGSRRPAVLTGAFPAAGFSAFAWMSAFTFAGLAAFGAGAGLVFVAIALAGAAGLLAAFEDVV